MMRYAGIAAVTALVAACAGGSGAGETAGGGSAAADDSRMLTLFEGRIRTAKDKFIQLAEAVPEDRYDWRPMDGVRSFREVFIHVAADNWAPLWMDVPAPEGAIDRDSIGPYQQQRLDKAATRHELERSFDFILSALAATEGRLDQRVNFGGREWQYDEMWVALVTHMHEHLGQVIAYARANEIVPPWTAAREQAAGR